MTSEYNANHSTSEDAASRSVREAFAALPFEKKIATLLRIELDMFGDAIDTVVNAASRAADEISDYLSGKEAGEQTGQSGNL
jgi:hypothetical protein